MSTSDEWIVQRTGVRERRMSPDTYRMLLRLAEAPDKTAFMREVRDNGLDGSIHSTLMVSDLALEASRMALKHAELSAEDLDCIIDSSTLPDYSYPHTGCVLQGKLGLTTTPVFNLQQGCAGFVYGLAMADQFIRADVRKAGDRAGCCPPPSTTRTRTGHGRALADGAGAAARPTRRRRGAARADLAPPPF